MNNNTVYTAIIEGENIKCIDTSTGSICGSTNLIGTVISGPTVAGDRCTVVMSSYMGKKGYVFKLPLFQITTSFDA